MDPTGIDGTDAAFVALNIGIVVVVALAIVYAVLVVMAALGLTSFSIFERYRRKPPEEVEEGGIDDLLSSDPRIHPGACTSSCAAGCDVAG